MLVTAAREITAGGRDRATADGVARFIRWSHAIRHGRSASISAVHSMAYGIASSPTSAHVTGHGGIAGAPRTHAARRGYAVAGGPTRLRETTPATRSSTRSSQSSENRP